MDPGAFILIVLAVIGVIVVGTLVFGGWVIVSIVRLLARAIGGGGPASAPPARLPPRTPQRASCFYANCRADNVPSARFCRRCGRPVAGRHGAVVRRVAMW